MKRTVFPLAVVAVLLGTALPRLAALAEVSWSTSRRTSYADFVKRITRALLPIYKARGYNYADYVF